MYLAAGETFRAARPSLQKRAGTRIARSHDRGLSTPGEGLKICKLDDFVLHSPTPEDFQNTCPWALNLLLPTVVVGHNRQGPHRPAVVVSLQLDSNHASVILVA